MSKTILKLKRATRFFLDELNDKKPYLGNRYLCPNCNTGLAYFNQMSDSLLDLLDKYEAHYSIFCTETLNWRQYSCPNCGVSDRERLYLLYFNEVFNKTEKLNQRMLDIAPTAQISKYLKSLPFIEYRSADIEEKSADDQVDICDMNIYEDNRFDIVLCSHVLEHVQDDKRAMSELFRVLKPGGWGILMVPINLSVKEDLEDPNIVTEADRWKYYGQHDHVRRYSKSGYVKKLGDTGFIVQQLGVEHFGKDVFDLHGIHHRSVLYVVSKPQ